MATCGVLGRAREALRTRASQTSEFDTLAEGDLKEVSKLALAWDSNSAPRRVGARRGRAAPEPRRGERSGRGARARDRAALSPRSPRLAASARVASPPAKRRPREEQISKAFCGHSSPRL